MSCTGSYCLRYWPILALISRSLGTAPYCNDTSTLKPRLMASIIIPHPISALWHYHFQHLHHSQSWKIYLTSIMQVDYQIQNIDCVDWFFLKTKTCLRVF